MDRIRSDNGPHGLREFLLRFPGMSLRPHALCEMELRGDFEFAAEFEDKPRLEDTVRLKIQLTGGFPKVLPLVYDSGSRIPRHFHTNPGGDLCLGSRLRLLEVLRRRPTLVAFSERILIPFLYAFVHWERFKELPFPDLAHGTKGILDDYRVLFDMPNNLAVPEVIKILGLKKRVGNKLSCPCGSGRRFGTCHGKRLERFRALQGRADYRQELKSLRNPRRH